ncbi:MAG: DUF87 domain-containing protein [Nanoarchaeota archaeon]|nr:DUF87 domain-containing protein [Nanoarchaeota archaeon]
MDIKILLGVENEKEIYWRPDKEKNPHMLITGFSGTGKTNLLKSIIFELSKFQIPCVIIDFDEEFLEFSNIIFDMKNLSINPLESRNNIPLNITAEVSSIFRDLYHLGDQQTAMLIKAIEKSYTDKGIDMKTFSNETNFPDFSDVQKNLMKMENDDNGDRTNIAKLMNKLDFLFKIGIFSGRTTIPYEEIMKTTTIFELKYLPTNDIRIIVSEFFLSKLWHHVSQLNKSKEIILYCIIDESYNITYKGSPLEFLLRGLRKYGIGIILASQNMSDFRDVVSNIGIVVSFQHRSDIEAKTVAKEINVDPEDIRNLTDIGSAFVKFASETSARKVQIKEYSERLK